MRQDAAARRARAASWRSRGERSCRREAVLFRKIEAVAPTLLLDETDAIFNAKNGEHRAAAGAPERRQPPRHDRPALRRPASSELVDFDVFCPKALAGIGELPDTVADRSIPIRLARKRPDEHGRALPPPRGARARRADSRRRSPRGRRTPSRRSQQARPDDARALDDRAEEAWEPLLAIADLAGGDWPERARDAARAAVGAGRARRRGARREAARGHPRRVRAAGVDRLSSATSPPR